MKQHLPLSVDAHDKIVKRVKMNRIERQELLEDITKCTSSLSRAPSSEMLSGQGALSSVPLPDGRIGKAKPPVNLLNKAHQVSREHLKNANAKLLQRHSESSKAIAIGFASRVKQSEPVTSDKKLDDRSKQESAKNELTKAKPGNAPSGPNSTAKKKKAAAPKPAANSPTLHTSPTRVLASPTKPHPSPTQQSAAEALLALENLFSGGDWKQVLQQCRCNLCRWHCGHICALFFFLPFSSAFSNSFQY